MKNFTTKNSATYWLYFELQYEWQIPALM